MTGTQHKIVGTGFGIAGAWAIYHGQGDPYGVLVLPLSIAGSMLPDIDHDMTKIGRKRKAVTSMTTKTFNLALVVGIIGAAILAIITMFGIRNFGYSPIELGLVAVGLILVCILKKVLSNSKTFKWATKHRGIMHTLVVPAILFLAMRISDFPLWRYSMLGLFIGYCSHLFADMLTVEGCPILFPLTKNNKRFLTLKTKNKCCSYAAKIVAILAAGIGIVFF